MSFAGRMRRVHVVSSSFVTSGACPCRSTAALDLKRFGPELAVSGLSLALQSFGCRTCGGREVAFSSAPRIQPTSFGVRLQKGG